MPGPPAWARVPLDRRNPWDRGASALSRQRGWQGMKNNPISWTSMARSALILLSATLAASAQTALPDHPSTDAEKIADALRAGPRFITKDATLLDWPTTPDEIGRASCRERV